MNHPRKQLHYKRKGDLNEIESHLVEELK
jgi:Kelch motif/Galactose oxidase, central domain